MNLESLPDAVIVFEDDRLSAFNRAAAELLGPLDPFVGRPLADLGVRSPAGERVEGAAADFGDKELVFGTDGDPVCRVSARASDATAVWSLRPAGDRSGMAVISTVSHELRSPLTSVKGYVALMLSRWDRLEDERKREMLEQVHHDADRVTRLVSELLDISRLESGRLVLRRQEVNLDGLARSVVEKVAMGYEDLDCTIDLPALPVVYADPDKLEQVLTNLVENAAKYASPTGMVIDGRADGGWVSVAVHDRGEGIPASELADVFTKFFRRDHTKPTGTGLGLWISRGLVEVHGGELTATSEIGVGSTFRFTVPLSTFDDLHPSDG